jgi:transcription factor HY5
MESDEEIRRVPEFGIGSDGPSTSGRGTAAAGPDKAQSSVQPVQKRRVRSPADKEHKRLKRYNGFLIFLPFSLIKRS